MFTTRHDFDCGNFINDWSVFVVRPNGQHIPGLQWSLADATIAELVCKSMNEKVEAMINESIDLLKVDNLSHQECYIELQDFWISEAECNSVDFEVVYGRMSLTEIRNVLRKYRAKTVYNVVD